jgi:hypothetical protein
MDSDFIVMSTLQPQGAKYRTYSHFLFGHKRGDIKQLNDALDKALKKRKQKKEKEKDDRTL